MTRFASVTPNLIARDLAASLAFCRDVLGFTITITITITMSVPDAAPYVFVGAERDGVPMFLNDLKSAEVNLPIMAAPPATVVMPLKTQFCGMREFTITDPDGHMITFAERVSAA